jgi:hypothetical protein
MESNLLGLAKHDAAAHHVEKAQPAAKTNYASRKFLVQLLFVAISCGMTWALRGYPTELGILLGALTVSTGGYNLANVRSKVATAAQGEH